MQTPRTLLEVVLASRHWTVEEAARQFDVTAQEMVERTSVSVKQLRRWLSGEVVGRPRAAACRVAERLFGHPIDDLLAPPSGYADRTGTGWQGAEQLDERALVMASAEESARFAERAELSNVGPFTMEQFHSDLRSLSGAYLDQPPVGVFVAVREVRDRAFRLLEGRQRPAQTRELYAAAGYACTLLAWISGDLGRADTADVHARTAWLCAELADLAVLRAWVLSTRSKTAFWQHRYTEATRWAQQGRQFAAGTSAGVLLACQEADAWAELGAAADARQALDRATAARDNIEDVDEIGGLLACNVARQFNYAAGVQLRLGDPTSALTSASDGLAAYGSAETSAYGTVAQLHVTRGLSHLAGDDVDGAATALAPVLDLSVDKRLDTVVQRLRGATRGLAVPRLRGSRDAAGLRDRIESFCADTPAKALPA